MIIDMTASQGSDVYYLANHSPGKNQVPAICNILYVDGHVANGGEPTEIFYGNGSPNFLWPKEVDTFVRSFSP